MIKIIYKGSDFNKVKADILSAYDFVYKKFLIKTPKIIIHVYENRNDLNKRLGRETENWLVAVASKNEISILSPNAIARESNHNKKEFKQILKHELTHIFLDSLAKGSPIPKWLNEGCAAYIAKQHQKDKITFEIEKDFCKKLSNYKDWDKRVNKGAYGLSALFVLYLVKKYSFNKVKEIIISLDKVYVHSKFQKNFFRIFNITLDKEEQLFLKTL